MTTEPKRLLGEIMVEMGYITEEDLQRALSLQRDMSDSSPDT